MERTAIQPPKACFGMEQSHGNPICRECPYRRECADLMGNLVGRLDVDQVPFHFMPPAFVDKCRDTNVSDPDLPRMDSVYVFCFEWVFGSELKGRIREDHVKSLLDHRAMIRERIREAGTSVKMFFLTNMLAWRRTKAEGRFHPKFMMTEFSARQVKELAKTCQSRFGAFDVTGLDTMMDSDVATHDFETLLLNSEIVAGSWIVNYKVFHSGQIIKRLYAEKETALNPYWLSIEPSYWDSVLHAHLSNPGLCESKVLLDHRWNVSQLLGRLKKQQRKAIAVFSARERIMPEAVQRVLGQRGLRAEHFEIENIPVVNAMKFWVRLGNAVQHYECLKFVDNYPSVFDAHFSRT